MKHRKLRIAWSAAWGITTVLSVGLWTRSFFISDHIRIPLYETMKAVVLHSESGSVTFDTSDIATQKRWVWYSTSLHGGTTSRFGLAVPFWICMLTAALLAIGPWLSPRFSLRTLLIAMSLVAAGLSLIVWRG